MRYRIVRPEDLERITVALVHDAADANGAIEKVPEATPLPNRVAVICDDCLETLVIVGPDEPVPSIVQRGGQPPIASPPPVEAEALTPPYDQYTVDQLEAEIVRRALPPVVEGSGSNGNVVKQDLIDALVASDEFVPDEQ